MIVKLSKERIDAAFADASNQGDWLLDLYRYVIEATGIPWQQVRQIEGWPRVHEKTWRYICQAAQRFDAQHHPECVPGGLWINRGFTKSSNEDPAEWTVDTEGVKVQIG